MQYTRKTCPLWRHLGALLIELFPSKVEGGSSLAKPGFTALNFRHETRHLCWESLSLGVSLPALEGDPSPLESRWGHPSLALFPFSTACTGTKGRHLGHTGGGLDSLA